MRGTVQGVGFRPTVARVARRLGLAGWVKNDGDGVLLRLVGPREVRDSFVAAFLAELPPLAHVESVERSETGTLEAGESGPEEAPASGLHGRESGPLGGESGPPGVATGFVIVESDSGAPHTAVAPDAATCAACLAEIRDPGARRFRYPFTNCTHCGPRFTIVTAIPYDRQRTTMAPFALCAACRAEYTDEGDRRYHAEPIACPRCGPHVSLEPAETRDVDLWGARQSSSRPAGSVKGAYGGDPAETKLDVVVEAAAPARVTDANVDVVVEAAALIRQGAIVAVKGLGGYHLCCDATSERAVAALRERKRRRGKPFALMVRDLAMAEQWCHIGSLEREALTSTAAPIVLLERLTTEGASSRDGASAVPDADGAATRESDSAVPDANRGATQDSIGAARSTLRIASAVAPGQRTLGVMLPATPLHHLLMERLEGPIVCTSGNLSEEPQCVDAAEARERLGGIADFFLHHDRGIAQRIDDSVVRVADGEVRVIRRARGFAPAPLRLPPGFEKAPRVTAMGAQLKGTVCLLQEGHAVLSQHLGDLDDRRTLEEQRRTVEVLSRLYQHEPALVAVDRHPDYASTREGASLAEHHGVPLVEVQHHHAHIAACLAEHQVPLGAGPVLGIALDGLGYGEDGALWGGEFLRVRYTGFERVASFRAVALPGGDLASREPWRNLYAYLMTGMNRQEMTARTFGRLHQTLLSKPLSILDQALRTGIGAPLASSCGRLFDAVAAAVGLHAECVDHEGQAAIALEQAVTPEALAAAHAEVLYPVMVRPAESAHEAPTHEGATRGRSSGRANAGHSLSGAASLPALDASTLFPALLRDLAAGAGASLIAARFHVALGDAIVRMALGLLDAPAVAFVDRTVALGGGVWQNRVLLEIVAGRLRGAGVRVLVPREVPANDGGVALGQAVVAGARFLVREATCA